MRVNTPFMTVVGGVAGAVCAVVAFQSGTAQTGTPTAYRTRPTVSTALTSVPRTTTLWLPCAKGSHLHRGACVIVRHRVVTVVDPAPAVVAPVALPAPARAHKPATHPASSHHSGGSGDGTQPGDDGSGGDVPEPGDDGSGGDTPEPGDH